MESSTTPAERPPAPPKSRTATLMDEIRRTPAFRQLIPQEAGLGWPLPLRRGHHVYITLPVYGMGTRGKDGEGVPIYPPFATLTLVWPTGQIVHYRHLRHDPAFNWPPEVVGAFPHPAVTGMSRGEYMAKRNELLAGYDVLLNILAKREPIPAPFADKFGQVLRTMVEPGLVPYYRKLSPDFVNRFIPEE